MGPSKAIVVGVGYSPLTATKIEILRKAKRIYLFSKTLELLERSCEDRNFWKEIKGKVEEIKKVNELLEKKEDPLVIVAGGDPLYFGLGETLKRSLLLEVEVYPDFSVLQLACAKAGFPIYQVKSLSFHGRGFNPEELIYHLRRHHLLGILTDPQQNVKVIAKALYEASFRDVKIHLFERLSYPEERYSKLNCEEAMEFEPLEPHFVILENNLYGKKRFFALGEEEIYHHQGLITKDEVRAIAIHQLRLPWRGVIWDVGAGSGSVGLEIASLSPELEVYAIEEKESQCDKLLKNKKKFFLPNLKIIYGSAPQVFKDLPSPDRVFLGGSGGRLREILQTLREIPTWQVLVATFTLLENFFFTLNFFSEHRFNVRASQINVLRLESLKEKHRFKPQNPVYILQVQRT